MLSSITPLGERGRGTSWRRTVAAYVAGSSLSGIALGGILGWFGEGVPHGIAWPAVLGALCIAGIAVDRGIAGARLPTVRRQVDERWLRIYRGWVYGFGYGAQLGLGVGTIVVSSAIYAMLAAEFLAGSATRGSVIGGVFGLVRASTILLGHRARDQITLLRLHEALERSRGRVVGVTQALLAATAIAGLSTAIR